jgi:hypothetical protein
MTQRQYNSPARKARRPLIFFVMGLFLLSIAGVLIYGRLRAHGPTTPVLNPYRFSIQQNVIATPKYKQNSFFTTTPDPSNTAFLTDLTDSIDATFSTDFHASEATDLSYQYQATALIRALYGSDKSTEGGMSTVWSKQFVVSAPVKGSRHDKSWQLKPTVTVPFALYKQKMEQFRKAYSTPTSSELVVTYTLQLTGNVRGTQIQETKTSTITAPLDQQVYIIGKKYEKTTNRELVPVSTKRVEDLIAKFDIPLVVALILAGTACSLYGFRKQKIKTPYQRELEKIYRYHDGIIIRAKRPPDLGHKNVVSIKSFEDILSLEEELKTPIIASSVSDYTTHFFIARDDIVYVYTLGVPASFKENKINT